MMENKLPADPASLILGIIALVLGIAGCCCYGVLAIVPLTLSIVGLVMANKSLKSYKNAPEDYTDVSASNVSTARVINIIAVILNSVIFLAACIIVVAYGTFLSTAILEGIRESQNSEYDAWETSDDYESTDETIYDYSEKVDSLELDSLIYKEEIQDTITINNSTDDE